MTTTYPGRCFVLQLVPEFPIMMFLLREWEINPQEKQKQKQKNEQIQDPAGIPTQNLLNTSQTLLPLSHLDPYHNLLVRPLVVAGQS